MFAFVTQTTIPTAIPLMRHHHTSIHYMVTEISGEAYHAVETIIHRNMVKQSSHQTHHNYGWQKCYFSMYYNLSEMFNPNIV